MSGILTRKRVARFGLLGVNALVLLGSVGADISKADDLATYAITLQNHQFTPAEIHVPAGKPFIVVVTNANGDDDEFEMLFPASKRSYNRASRAR